MTNEELLENFEGWYDEKNGNRERASKNNFTAIVVSALSILLAVLGAGVKIHGEFIKTQTMIEAHLTAPGIHDDGFTQLKSEVEIEGQLREARVVNETKAVEQRLNTRLDRIERKLDRAL